MHCSRNLVETSAEVEKWEGRRLLSLEKQRNNDQQIERLRTELEATEKLKIELTSKLEASRKKMVESETDYGKVASEMDGISQILKRSVKETEKEIDELKSTYIDRLNEEATIRNDLKHIEERLEGEKSSSERIRQQTSLLKERLAHLTAEKKRKSDWSLRVEKEVEECRCGIPRVFANIAQNGG